MPAYGLAYGLAELQSIIQRKTLTFCSFTCVGIYAIKLLLTLSLVHMENICCDVMPHGPHFVWSIWYDVTTSIFAYGLHCQLIRAYY